VGTSGAGDLTIASPIDQSHYIARESSSGVNLSIPVPIPGLGLGAPSLGLSAGQLHLMAQYEAVRQQSVLSAGVDGFDVTVNGHTHLEGGALTTEGVVGGSRLVTQTLTHEGVSNRDVVEGRSWSVGINVGNLGQNGQNLGGSSAGYARIDTNQRSQTVASVGGVFTLTRPDLQASRATALKAAERAPLAQRLDQVQQQLSNLYDNEPPRCATCQPNMISANYTQAAPAQTLSPEAQAAMGTNPEWQAWLQAVQALQAESTQLNQRIAAINAKVYGTAANLISNPSSLHQPLLHTFDSTKATQELRDGVAVTAAFGKAAYQWAGGYANAQRVAASAACGSLTNCPEAELWKEGGIYRTALHMAIGSMSLGTAGAAGNLASNLMLNAMEKALLALRITNPDVANLLRNAAYIAGGFAGGAAAGAVTAFNADTNNRQLHPDEVKYARSKIVAWAAQRGITTAQAETELARGALYGVDLTWRQSYNSYTPQQVVAYQAAAQFLVNEARRDGFVFTNLEGLPQTGFTATQAQFENTRYLMNAVLKDASARRMYSDKAAIALNEMTWAGQRRFFANGGLGFGAGVPQGVEQALLQYAALLNPSTYARLVDSAVAFARDPRGVLNQLIGSMPAAAQEAAFGVYLSWLQSDSASLGQAGGRIFGQLLVDAAATVTGVAVINNGRVVAQGLAPLQTAASQRITAEIEAQAARALQQTGGVFRNDGSAFINLFDDPALTKQHKGSMGELLGQNTVSLLLPDGLKVGRTQGIGGKGIDDLYAVSRPGVDYVIIEYKFGSSSLNTTLDGRQMSDSWLIGSNTSFNRIRDSVGGDMLRAEAIRDALNAGRIEKWLVHVDPAGQTSVVLMNANGGKIKTPMSRVIETTSPGP
jgi:hypothetical protein